MIDATRPAATPRLAYVVLAPGNPVLLEAWRVRVDAQTGEILSVENRVKTGGGPAYNGSVFVDNPVKTPSLVTQPLGPWMDLAQDPTVHLQGPDVKVLNCVDQQQCQTTQLGSVHVCSQIQSAGTTVGGDYLTIARPGSDLDGEDQFAEVQMFYHVNRVYEFFRGFGFTDLADRPLTAVVNERLPIDFNDIFGTIGLATCTNGVPQAAHHLYPLDNAAFTPDGSLFGITGGAIVFGQGTAIDFAYDGDVVYHEFTHAVMGTLTPEFGANTFDEFGEDPTTGGMNEGTADYFSAALAGDPDLGEYSGPPLGGTGGALRHLTNDKTCPSSLWNEVHQDGEEWAGALWDVRAALPVEKQHDYDQAVYNAIAALSPSDDQITTAAMVAAEVGTVIGTAERDLAIAKFAARGLDDCSDRVVDMTAGGLAVKDVLFVSGTDAGANPAPGPVQFKIDVPAGGASKIKIATLASQANGGGFGGGSAPALKLIVKPGDAAILWSYGAASATHDAIAMGDITCGTSGNMPCTGEIAGSFQPGPHVVQIINTGGGAIIQGVSFSTEGSAAAPDAGTGGADAGPPGEDTDDGGCGCRVGGESGRAPLGGFALAGLAAFLIVLAARRRGR
jgi:hypothetical protein